MLDIKQKYNLPHFSKPFYLAISFVGRDLVTVNFSDFAEVELLEVFLMNKLSIFSFVDCLILFFFGIAKIILCRLV